MVRTIFILSLFCFAASLSAADGLLNQPTGPDRLIEIKRRAEGGEVNAQKAYADELQSTLKYAAAEHWYRRAAITGNPDALSALAELYHGNRGFGKNAIKGNFTNALALHQLAAIQGNRRSHGHLGHAYMNGNVFPKDPIKAYRHLKLASPGSNDQYLNRLILEMSQDQIADAEAQAKAFKPVPFKAAFETLALDSLKLESITGPGNQRYALINGKPCNPTTPLQFPIATLPATFTCDALTQTSITLTIGSTTRTYTLNR